MENIDFVSIYRKYRSRAFNIGKFILGDEDEAEDVCQDVFETLFHMGRSVDFSDEKKLENLIVRISYHKASDHRKKAFRKYEYANSDAILEMTDMRVRKGNRVDEIVLNLEAAGYLRSIFEKLREKNRTNYEAGHRPEEQSHVMEPHMQIIFMVKFHVHAAWKARNLKNMRKTQDF